MNYMAKIAEMLGVELGEVFCMKHSRFHQQLREYQITENGFLSRDNSCGEWSPYAAVDFERLFCGQIEIIKRPWKPKIHNSYWALFGGVNDEPEALCTTWNGSVFDLMYYKNGCVYRTKEECERNKKSDYEKLTGEKWKW